MSLFFKPRLPDVLGQQRDSFWYVLIGIVSVSLGLGVGRWLWPTKKVDTQAMREAWRTNATTNLVPPEARP